jgi:deoxyribodipyrimidine photo-lyase
LSFEAPTLWWIRLDLRLADNPALVAALARGGPVLPVFVWAPDEEVPFAPGAASRWWLHHSLVALSRDLEAVGSRLVVRRAPSSAAALDALVAETGAQAVFWSRRYEPSLIGRDAEIKRSLRARGLVAESANASLLYEPWTILDEGRTPFRVFSPFWRRCLAAPEPAAPLAAPARLPAPDRWPESIALEALDLLPEIPWDGGLRAAWRPGEAGAQARLAEFLASAFAGYASERDRPDRLGTSRLSPHLHFGEISPRQVWAAMLAAGERAGLPVARGRQGKFAAELGWREFAHHLLFHFPETTTEPLRPEFARYPWRDDAAALRAWQRGRTGIPIVDAGMRELWTTGWMHNRVRMLVASLLTKNLSLPWQEGAAWFWDTLVDADLASNTLGWQWTAGCGADAASYVRIFNPVSQGVKFDPAGDYVRRFVPELARLSDDWIQQPWEAPPLVLHAAGIVLGETYPRPIVDLAESREAALRAFAALGT